MNLTRCLQTLKKFVAVGSTNLRFSLPNVTQVSNFHSLTSSLSNMNNALVTKPSNFLTSISSNIMPVCGMKTKGRVRKRCPDCYMVYKDHRVFNYCKTKPKHNQMNKVLKEKFYYLITEVTRGRVRKY